MAQTMTRKRAATSGTRVQPAPAVDGPSIRTGMGTIADEARKPIGKSPEQDQPVPLDDRMRGNTLAAEVVAYQRAQQRGQWAIFATRIRSLTREGREAFLKAIRQWLASARKMERFAAARNMDKEGEPEPTREESKRAARIVASATVEVSKLSTIATAWNEQATDEGLVAFYLAQRRGKTDVRPDEVPYAHVYAYAKSMNNATAGRKSQPFAIVVQKFLERTKPREEAGDGEPAEKLHAALVALVNEAVKALPQAPRDPLTTPEMLGI